MTRDQEILEILPRYTVPMLSKPLRRSFPILFQKRKFREKISHDGKEVEDLLCMRVINLIYQQKDQHLSILFLALKKDGNQRPVINLKQLNQFIPYQHFKEGLHCLKKVTRILEYARICWNMQAGFEGYLFLCPIKQKIREMWDFFGQVPTRIHLPFLWPRASTAGIHKIVENSCGFPPIKYTSNYMPIRCASA